MMARWVTIDDGSMVNIDHVHSISRAKRDSKGIRMVMLYNGTSMIGEAQERDVKGAMGDIIAALPGYQVILFDFSDGEFWSIRYQIIAWRITDVDCPTPVTVDGEHENNKYVIIEPNGSVVRQSIQSWDSWEQAAKDLEDELRPSDHE